MSHDIDIQRGHEDPTTEPDPTTSSPNTTETSEKNNRHYNDQKSNGKNNRQNTATTTSGNPHPCITRSDGVVRALRARTGDPQRTTSKIISEGF